jgi:hypothetical protein
MAGRPVRLRLVGRRLAAQLCPALAHLRTETTDAPALTIEVWDEKETGVSCPPAAREDSGGKSWPVGQGFFMSSGEGRHVGYLRLHSATWIDRKKKRICGWVESADQLSLFERGKPFHFLLSVWHNDCDVLVVHAGLVARNGNAVLFPGMGGAGKSTTSLACLRYGFDYLAEDYIGLEAVADGRFEGHSIFASTWLETDHHEERFDDLSTHAIGGSGPGEDKDLVFLPQLYPDRMARQATIRAVALPRIVDAETTTWRKASKGEALRTAAPSSMLCLIPRPDPRSLERIARLVETVPCYWLELGRAVDTIAPCVDELLSEAIAT